MPKNDGGPAFPYFPTEYSHRNAEGMTLRQYYKAAAIQGILSSEDEDFIYTPRRAAERAAEIADAMIEEDEEHETGN